jgi:hypothetical protein
MTHDEIEKLIGDKFWLNKPPEVPPSESEWALLESQLGCQFPTDFRVLHDLMAKYIFEGEYLCIAPVENYDDIATVYNYERNSGRNWPVELIPFYSVGNGDYLCFKSSECPESAVYYIYHEDDTVKQVHGSLAAWLKDPEWFP